MRRITLTHKRIKWILFLIPAFVIGSFETIRHTLLQSFLPTELGNWITAIIDAAVIAFVSRGLFQQFTQAEKTIAEERASRAVLEERERLARALHDQIAQAVFYAGVQVSAAKELKNNVDCAALQTKLNDISVSLRDIDEHVRQAIFNLQYPSLDSSQFADRIRTFLVKRFVGTHTTWDLQFPEHEPSLPNPIQIQLFGILQEAVTNIIKHADATHVDVYFENNSAVEPGWTFTIQDNGHGFDTNDTRENAYGLDIIRNRAKDIGAMADIESNTDGSKVRISYRPNATLSVSE
jgi:signal transduction histidine kinase